MGCCRASLLLAVLAAGCAKVTVIPVRDQKVVAEGMFYALPRTVARVHLKVDKATHTAAPFRRFAAIFAPGGTVLCSGDEKPEDACAEDADGQIKNTKFAIQPGVSLSTFGEPDPEHVYLVRFSGGRAVDQTLNLAWSETGLLSSASASVTNRSIDIATAGLKLVAGLGTKLGYGAAEGAVTAEARSCDPPSPNDEWVNAVLEKEGGDAGQFLFHNYCAIPGDVRENAYGKTNTEAGLKQALRAYVLNVLPLVQGRSNLIAGRGTTLDSVALIHKLDALIERQLNALYLGQTSTKTWEGALDVRDLRTGSEIPLLQVAVHHGICIASGLLAPESKPIPEGFLVSDPKRCGGATPVVLTLDYHPDVNGQLFQRIRTATSPPRGDRSFRYRVPAQVRAAVKSGAATRGTGVFSVAQLGEVVSLPAKRHSKALSYDLAMIEATGGLKSFKLGTTGGLDAATIDALAGAGGGVLDARNAARKAAQEKAEAEARAAALAADELTVVTREHTLLKLKHEICEIQKLHGIACTVEP